MASSSSSRQPNYDVFLSFRGGDTRLAFTNYLLKELENRGIEVFFDEKKLTKGEEISQELLAAIVASKISIVILSEDYASSRSCLTELSQIIDCKRTQGQIVLPIFYRVDPSDVRKHGGSFGKSFDEHLRNKAGETERWKRAFTEAGKLGGWHIKGCSADRPEPAYIEEIVQAVIQKLKNKSPSCFKDQLVGIDNQKKEIISLLCIPEETPRSVVIAGMGGIGKTTIAQAVYDEVSDEVPVQFDCCCFIQNVREKLVKRGMESLRNELLSKVLKGETKIDTPSIGSTLILERLGNKRVLVVLDDVNDYDQIEGLGVQHFGPGSKIIVTSRDKEVLKPGAGKTYVVKLLNYKYSLQLFSRSAFQQDQPVADFRDLSDIFVEYARGLPLVLKVLGGALCQKHRGYWESARDKLEKYPHPKIFNSLMISFEGLDVQEQDIFLDIAFFFEGEDKEDVQKILDSCYKGALCGITNLVSKFLIDENLQMHDLLREMGCKIVHQQSDDPGKRSRLKSKHAYYVLKNNKGTESIVGISLDLSEVSEQLQLCPSVFDKMVNLRFIRFYYPPFIGNQNRKEFKLLLPRQDLGNQNQKFKLLLSEQGLSSLPDKLRFLHWEYCPLKSFPSNFGLENLVELKLTDCENLTRIPVLSQAINIRTLHIASCKRLAELPCLDRLPCLSTLHIEHCPIIKFPEVPRNLEYLGLYHTQIGLVPSSIGSLNKLSRLVLRGTRIQNLPPSIEKLDSLVYMDLSGCPKITNFPSVPEKIQTIELNGTPIAEVPSSISRLKNLSLLYMADCYRLKSISGLPPGEQLMFHGCESLTQVTISNLYQYKFHERKLCELEFHESFNLKPDAIDDIVAHTLLQSQAMAKLYAEELAEKVKVKHDFGKEGVVCCFPGNKISERFENQSGYSTIADLGSIRCGYRGRFLGFVLCVVVDLWFARELYVGVQCRYQLKTKYGDYHNYESDFWHVCSRYPRMLGREFRPLQNNNLVFILFNKDMLQEDKEYEGASFRFDVQENDSVEVRECGVYVLSVDAKSSDDCNVRSNKRFRSVEDGVEFVGKNIHQTKHSQK